ncbi:hypothetical protein [Streptoalloteichus hindustanus]|uniref:Uncharacterized protein n=1 Tax=Streptoalloteichus hindustanus TaxID=2017 RepID=A0A1M5FHP1_STRHI|nr:hypothetical protein [Streptoalloteichus hindustanus]SHF91033.1 hypothetical protein SAMN05444320_105446 [Streptoalloteichus hindustanus]
MAERSGGSSVVAVLGVVLVVQGFGSAVTEALWQNSFGASALLRAAGAPGWSDFVVGALGVVLLGCALVRRGARNGARSGARSGAARG